MAAGCATFVHLAWAAWHVPDMEMIKVAGIKKSPLLGGFFFVLVRQLRQFPEPDQGLHGVVPGDQDPAGIIGLEVNFLIRPDIDDL